MGRDQDAGEFEWVNAWAATSGAPNAATAQSEIVPAPAAPPAFPRFTATSRREAEAPEPAPFAAVPLPDQLMRDIAEIERARDALATGPLGTRMRTFMVVPSRAAESVPLLVGGVLALVMLSVFAAAG